MDLQAIRGELAQIEVRKAELIGGLDEGLRAAQSERDQAQAAVEEATTRLAHAEATLQEATANRNALI